MSELIRPNLHIALVHFPIALILVGVLIEVLSFLGWRRSSFRTAGRWMILLGAISSLGTATSGVYAMKDVTFIPVADELTLDASWAEITRVSPVTRDAEQAELMSDHVVAAAVGSGLTVLACCVWIGSTDLWRRRLHWPLVAALLLACAAMLSAAHLGGKMVYDHAIGVKQPYPVDAPEDVAGWSGQVARVVPPLQLHVTLAGSAVAMSLVSLAVSWRATHEAIHTHRLAGRKPIGQQIEAQEVLRELDPSALKTPPTPVPAGRIALLAAVMLGSASLAGWWYLIHDSGTTDLAELWRMTASTELAESRVPRRLLHSIAGGALVALPIVLVVAAKLARRSRFIPLLLTPVALLLVALQVWLGVLLLLDGPIGSPARFRPAEGAQETPAPLTPPAPPVTQPATS